MNEPAYPAWLLDRTEAAPPPLVGFPGRKHEGFGRKTLRGLASVRTAAFSAARLAQGGGWLQRIGARAKVPGLVILLLAVNLIRHHSLLSLMCAMIYAAGRAAGIPGRLFLKRVWLLPAAFTFLIVLPSAFNWVRPGTPLLTLWRYAAPPRLGPLLIPPTLTLTREGLGLASGLILRVLASAGLVGLAALTTPWPELLQALRFYRVPRIFPATLEMAQRYLHLLLLTAQGYFLARESRPLGRCSGRAGRRFAGAIAGALFLKACHTAEQVHLAMISRGYHGEPVAAPLPPWRARDLFHLALALILALSFLGGDVLLGR